MTSLMFALCLGALPQAIPLAVEWRPGAALPVLLRQVDARCILSLRRGVEEWLSEAVGAPADGVVDAAKLRWGDAVDSDGPTMALSRVVTAGTWRLGLWCRFPGPDYGVITIRER